MKHTMEKGVGKNKKGKGKGGQEKPLILEVENKEKKILLGNLNDLLKNIEGGKVPTKEQLKALSAPQREIYYKLIAKKEDPKSNIASAPVVSPETEPAQPEKPIASEAENETETDKLIREANERMQIFINKKVEELTNETAEPKTEEPIVSTETTTVEKKTATPENIEVKETDPTYIKIAEALAQDPEKAKALAAELIYANEEKKPADTTSAPDAPSVITPDKELDVSISESEDTKKEVEHFINSMKLESLLSPEFKALTNPQQLLILNSLKQRIIDVVKDNAETQYSEDLKNKMATFGNDAGKGKRIWTSVKNSLTGIRANIKKDFTLKNLEHIHLEKLLSEEEGKNFIKNELSLLVKTTEGRNVEMGKDGKPIINFTEQINIENPTPEEKEIIAKYNEAANEWRQIPYEWGQEGKKVYTGEKKIFEGKNRKKYEIAKQKYEDAKREILRVKENRGENKDIAIYEMLILSGALELDQLINTHPEFQKELEKMKREPGFGDKLSNAKGFLSNILGGKGSVNSFANKLAFASGFGLRAGTKLGVAAVGMGTTAASYITFFAAPIIGGGIGAIKARLRGIDTLSKKEKDARYGQGNKKERDTAIMTNITHLSEQLDRLIKEVEIAKESGDETKISRALAMLSVRIEHTQGKFEKGQVNFGDKKSSVGNQMVLLENLNKALALKESLSTVKNDVTRKQEKNENGEWINVEKISTEKDINALLSFFGERIAKETTKEKKEFLKKQEFRGAVIGATLGVAGYGVRWLSEVTGTGEHLSEYIQNLSEKSGLADLTKSVGGGIHHLGEKIGMLHHSSPLESIPKANGEMPHSGDSISTKPLDGFPKVIQNAHQPNGDNYLNPQDHQLNQPVVVPMAPPVTQNIESGITTDFSVKLGENGVPRNLETVFTEISADHMKLPGTGMVDEQFATKSLNMGANLVELTKGHNVAGINAEEFGKVASFHNGILEIKDHNKFNDILGKLQEHADKSWGKGILQGKGAVAGYVRNISHDSWLKISHAEGLHESADGTSTGIHGHDINADKITDFNHSDIIEHSRIPTHTAGDLASQQVDPTLAGKSLADQQVDPLAVRTPKEAIFEDPKMGDTHPISPINEIHPKEAQIPIDKDIPEDSVTPEELKEITKIEKHNLHKIFHGKWGEKGWENLKGGVVKKSAQDILTMKPGEMEAHPIYTPLVAHMTKLQKVTGLLPYQKNLLRPEDESIEKYMIRALKKALKMGKIKEVKL